MLNVLLSGEHWMTTGDLKTPQENRMKSLKLLSVKSKRRFESLKDVNSANNEKKRARKIDGILHLKGFCR